MQTFTGIEYLLIDLANHYGLDKETWDDRISWAKSNLDTANTLKYADNPILFRKTLRAIDEVVNKQPTGHLIALDATASGIQIMSAIAGCESGCEMTNLIDTGTRRDVYGEVALNMNCNVTRDTVKYPIMTTFYGSTKQPKSIFGEDTDELQAFYDILNRDLEGAVELMEIMQSLWDPTATEYHWTLPDGHTAGFKVMIPEDKRIEVDELNHSTFTHRCYINAPVEKGLAMAANIVHSIDGYIVRQMTRKAHKQGFACLSIHDSFWCHPSYVNQMRRNYNQIFADEININLFNNIYNQLSGKPQYLTPIKNGLNKHFRNANYALS